MKYLSASEMAKKCNISERSAMNYCVRSHVFSILLTCKIWNVPENARKLERFNKCKEQLVTLLDILR